uniref:Uncharacterized protein n=1 Tax=Chromera velia CCMP2878 TaxID=1169474 RepID=A0A0G4GIG3_9ALVE|eukprot:Cvel_22047.t1-p1 / transcript=Cvel_22047.t1 / gene=Cvel_22047 / organism=Chromera_velia_CCMP2878 / gene_product=hypothetical protein / transcript_product=hypothetical protein / location=Cvel_scaffold2129:18763-31981(+) / protein_length=1331 / sequence_SO=supercontig / SO=protein_coding / is_pseudo=false
MFVSLLLVLSLLQKVGEAVSTKKPRGAPASFMDKSGEEGEASVIDRSKSNLHTQVSPDVRFEGEGRVELPSEAAGSSPSKAEGGAETQKRTEEGAREDSTTSSGVTSLEFSPENAKLVIVNDTPRVLEVLRSKCACAASSYDEAKKKADQPGSEIALSLSGCEGPSSCQLFFQPSNNVKAQETDCAGGVSSSNSKSLLLEVGGGSPLCLQHAAESCKKTGGGGNKEAETPSSFVGGASGSVNVTNLHFEGRVSASVSGDVMNVSFTIGGEGPLESVGCWWVDAEMAAESEVEGNQDVWDTYVLNYGDHPDASGNVNIDGLVAHNTYLFRCVAAAGGASIDTRFSYHEANMALEVLEETISEKMAAFNLTHGATTPVEVACAISVSSEAEGDEAEGVDGEEGDSSFESVKWEFVTVPGETYKLTCAMKTIDELGGVEGQPLEKVFLCPFEGGSGSPGVSVMNSLRFPFLALGKGDFCDLQFHRQEWLRAMAEVVVEEVGPAAVNVATVHITNSDCMEEDPLGPSSWEKLSDAFHRPVVVSKADSRCEWTTHESAVTLHECKSACAADLSSCSVLHFLEIPDESSTPGVPVSQCKTAKCSGVVYATDLQVEDGIAGSHALFFLGALQGLWLEYKVVLPERQAAKVLLALDQIQKDPELAYQVASSAVRAVGAESDTHNFALIDASLPDKIERDDSKRGCTSPSSWNYDTEATQDDGSCISLESPLAYSYVTLGVGVSLGPETCAVAQAVSTEDPLESPDFKLVVEMAKSFGVSEEDVKAGGAMNRPGRFQAFPYPYRCVQTEGGEKEARFFVTLVAPPEMKETLAAHAALLAGDSAMVKEVVDLALSDVAKPLLESARITPHSIDTGYVEKGCMMPDSTFGHEGASDCGGVGGASALDSSAGSMLQEGATSETKTAAKKLQRARGGSKQGGLSEAIRLHKMAKASTRVRSSVSALQVKGGRDGGANVQQQHHEDLRLQQKKAAAAGAGHAGASEASAESRHFGETRRSAHARETATHTHKSSSDSAATSLEKDIATIEDMEEDETGGLDLVDMKAAECSRLEQEDKECAETGRCIPGRKGSMRAVEVTLRISGLQGMCGTMQRKVIRLGKAFSKMSGLSGLPPAIATTSLSLCSESDAGGAACSLSGTLDDLSVPEGDDLEAVEETGGEAAFPAVKSSPAEPSPSPAPPMGNSTNSTTGTPTQFFVQKCRCGECDSVKDSLDTLGSSPDFWSGVLREALREPDGTINAAGDAAPCEVVSPPSVVRHPGCMDPEADNYRRTATEQPDESLCVFKLGCMDEEADNFDEFATRHVQSSCVYPQNCLCSCMESKGSI